MQTNLTEDTQSSKSNNNLHRLQQELLKILVEVDGFCSNHDIKYWLDSGTLLGAKRHQGFIPWDDDLDICMLRADYNKFLELVKEKGLGDELFLQTPQTDSFYRIKYIPCKIRLNNTLAIEKGSMENGLFNSRSHNGFYIDIFPIDKFSQNYVKRTVCERYIGSLIRRKMEHDYKSLSKAYKKPFRRLLGFLSSKFFSWEQIDILISNLTAKTEQKTTDYVYGYGVEMIFRKNHFVPEDIFPLQKITFEGKQFPCPAHVENILLELYGHDFMTLPPLADRNQHFATIEFLNDKASSN